MGNSGALLPETANYLKGHFLHEPLRDWDVSRPAPYFGFEIPDSPGNYWYVWFDAPIGYIASTKQWCDSHGEQVNDWWRSDETEIHHFIGKDITYFHTLFWPAMLKTAGFSLPKKVHIHGFLTVNGKKMSKRDGTFVQAATYLQHLDPAYLRYYYAAKLSGNVEDLDLNLDEFLSKVNSDVVGKFVNIASRTANFVRKSGLAAAYPDDGGLFAQAAQDGEAIAEAYESCDFARAMRAIMAVADRANKFIDENAPWNLKGPEQAARQLDVCTIGLNLFRQLAIYLAPVLPKMARDIGEFFNDPIVRWEQSQQPLIGAKVGKFQHLAQRVDVKKVEAMIAASAEPEEVGGGDGATGRGGEGRNRDDDAPLKAEPLAAECTMDDFSKIDLRVCRVLTAEEVPEAKKLLKLTISLGGNNTRTVFAGIKAFYQPEQLVGKLFICIANLAPRKMKFGLSEGMMLAAGGSDEAHLLVTDEGAKVGQRVH